LLLGKLSETVVVVGDPPHDRPGFLVGHLISNCASFLCTEAPMLRSQRTFWMALQTVRTKAGATPTGSTGRAGATTDLETNIPPGPLSGADQAIRR
jgi:hypothetical protein